MNHTVGTSTDGACSRWSPYSPEAGQVLAGPETEEIESINCLREEVDKDSDDPENYEVCGHRRNER